MTPGLRHVKARLAKLGRLDADNWWLYMDEWRYHPYRRRVAVLRSGQRLWRPTACA